MKRTFTKLTILSSLLLALVLETGCYKMGFKNGLGGGGDDESSGPPSAGGPAAPKALPNGEPGKTASVLNFRAVGKSLSNLAGVPLSTQANTFLTNDLTTYSLSNESDTITGPMLFNLAKLGAEVCKSLVAKETLLAAGTRRFYNTIDFNRAPATQISGAPLGDVVNRFSRIVCGHNASPEIITSLRTDLTAATTTNTIPDMTNAAIMVCTAYMASACTVTNN